MESQSVVNGDISMTDTPDLPKTPTASDAPTARPEYPIVVNTISQEEADQILGYVWQGEHAALLETLKALSHRDKLLIGSILVQARDAAGRNALHVALLRGVEELVMATLRFILQPQLFPPLFPALKREFLRQTTHASHGGDNPVLYACRLAMPSKVVQLLMAAGGALTGVHNAMGLNALQCVVCESIEGLMDHRDFKTGAGARLLWSLVHRYRHFTLGDVVREGKWRGNSAVHLAAQYDRVPELEAIVEMMGVSCLDVTNSEGLSAGQVAALHNSWKVSEYIERLQASPSGSS